jgi:hypothetical protein
MVFSGSGTAPNRLKRLGWNLVTRDGGRWMQITRPEYRSEERSGGVRDMRGSLPDMKPEPIDDLAWTERQDLVIQIASPEVAAEKLGRSLAAVLVRRQELGLPDPLSTRERLARQKKD